MSTKDRILEEALTLFAENGYDGTGVEQIAEKVGIKAPSLYKHFKGKEDIMTALIDSAEERYEESFGSEQHIGEIPENREDFLRATMGRIAFTMHDPMIGKIRKFLVQEQFRNERLAEITTRHQLVGIQKMYEKIIEGMMKNGLFIHGALKTGACNTGHERPHLRNICVIIKESGGHENISHQRKPEKRKKRHHAHHPRLSGRDERGVAKRSTYHSCD